MKLVKEITLKDFEFWGGATQFVAKLTEEELEIVEEILEGLENDDGHYLTETELNDFFWFDQDVICEWLGITEEEVWEKRFGTR